MTDGDLLTAITKILNEHARDASARDAELATRIDEVAALQRETNGQLSRVNAEIGFGLPPDDKRGDRRTLRERIHDLENDKQAMRLISARRAADWSHFQKAGLFIFAGLAALSGLLRLFGIQIG